MKYLNWLRDNVSVVSFLVGIGFFIAGRADIGHVLVSGGGV